MMRSYLSTVFFAVLCFFAHQGECRLSISYPAHGSYMPGDPFSFTCSGNLEEGDTFQFLKVGVTVLTSDGSIEVGYTENSTVLSTFDVLDPVLVETGRYSVQGIHNDSSFDLTLVILSLAVEDTGNFSCHILGADGSSSGKTHVTVKVNGPINRTDIVYQKRVDGNVIETKSVGGKLSYTLEDPPGSLVCIVATTTTAPTHWEMLLVDPETGDTQDVTERFDDGTSNDYITIEDGGLHSFHLQTLYSAPSPGIRRPAPRFDHKDLGKTLMFRVLVEGFNPENVSVELDMSFSPVETVCQTNAVRAPQGHKNLTLLCYTKSNPESRKTWKANNAALREGITVTNQIMKGYQVSLLVIDELQEADVGKYTFRAENDVGFSEQEVDVSISQNEEDVVTADFNDSALPWYEHDDDDGDNNDNGNNNDNNGGNSNGSSHTWAVSTSMTTLVTVISVLLMQ